MKLKAILMVAILVFAFPAFPAFGWNEKNVESSFCMAASNGEIINVTVQEVWEMLNNEEDGKQIPVDVRTFQEYYTERIATPHSYDKPRLYPLQLIEIPIFATIFNIIFAGKDIILYCRTAHRSYIAAKILMDSGWNGNLYNMEGGITAWKAAGLPTVKGLGIGG